MRRAEDSNEDILKYVGFIGKKVSKGKKPFKSGNKENTVTGIVMNNYVNRLAFIFEEDDSNVECWRCKIVESNASLTMGELRELVNEHRVLYLQKMAEELVGVQPMDSKLFSNLLESAMDEKDLIEQGYTPVSEHNLMWVK